MRSVTRPVTLQPHRYSCFRTGETGIVKSSRNPKDTPNLFCRTLTPLNYATLRNVELTPSTKTLTPPNSFECLDVELICM